VLDLLAQSRLRRVARTLASLAAAKSVVFAACRG
jgi:hypothetical protein